MKEELIREMVGFRAKVGRSGRAKFEGDGEHDDLVVAVALACWWERPQTEVGERSDGRLV
jgi:hypothetical protein